MTTAFPEPLLSEPKRLLLDLAQQQSIPALLQLIVSRLSETRRVALVRIWLAQPTLTCTGCPSVDVCRTQMQCLHLVASGGRSTVSPVTEWTNIEGAFRHMPFGARKVGRIALSGEPLEEPELTEPLPDWVARPDWIRAEGIRGFAGQPMIRKGHLSTEGSARRSGDEPSFEDGRLHSLRHFFCSLCANRQVSERALMEWLGHSGSAMVKRYYHLHDDESHRQMAKVEPADGNGVS